MKLWSTCASDPAGRPTISGSISTPLLAPAIRAAGGERRELKNVDEHSNTVRSLAVRRARLAGVMRGGAASVAVIAMILAGVTSVWTDLTPARLTTALLLVGLVSTPVQDMGRVGEYRQGYLAASLVLAKALRRGTPSADAASTPSGADAPPAEDDAGSTRSGPPASRRSRPTRGLLHINGLQDGGDTLPELLATPGSRIHLRSADPERAARVVAALVGDALEISARDDGPGFAEEVLMRLGQPYTSTKPRPGAGLGLFLLVNVIRSLGGAVEALETAASGGEPPTCG